MDHTMDTASLNKCFSSVLQSRAGLHSYSGSAPIWGIKSTPHSWRCINNVKGCGQAWRLVLPLVHRGLSTEPCNSYQEEKRKSATEEWQ